MGIDEAFSEYIKTGVAPKGYYLDKKKYWKGYNAGLSSYDAKSSAFRPRTTRPKTPNNASTWQITRMSGLRLKRVGEQ